MLAAAAAGRALSMSFMAFLAALLGTKRMSLSCMRQVGGLGAENLLQVDGNLLASLGRRADQLGRSFGRCGIRALGQRDCLQDASVVRRGPWGSRPGGPRRRRRRSTPVRSTIDGVAGQNLGIVFRLRCCACCHLHMLRVVGIAACVMVMCVPARGVSPCASGDVVQQMMRAERRIDAGVLDLADDRNILGSRTRR